MDVCAGFDYVGPDSFTVTVSDEKGGTTTSTVTIHMTEPPNRPPTVPNSRETTTKGASVTGSVYGTDPDGDSLTYTKGSDPQHGTVTVKPDGTWTYVPNPGYVGPDSFMVTVSDGRGGTITTKVTINVTDSGTDPGSDSDTSPDPGTNPDPVTPDKPSTDAGSGTTPTNTGTETTSGQRGNETSIKKPDQEKKLSQLPNTAASFYNLGAAGLAALVAGLVLMRSKNKA
ncbi:hypothetical protein Elgi_55970 [Paenibacillus elgii]|nr:hypothetical protein Elgi_55970 [Paenibacillus elgii]